jgi:organic radical activating enzyme
METISKEITINNVTTPFKCEDCTRSKLEKPYIIPHPQYILYVYSTSLCNASCKFCSEKNYNREEKAFESETLKRDLLLLEKQRLLKKISITGGEPFLNIQRLNSVVNTIFDTLPQADVSITTNGSFLERIYELDALEKISQIHISRHHYDQEINDSIFGIKTATLSEIAELQTKLKPNALSFNCCLIKDYIDSYREMKEYSETINRQTGISTIGYISLMGDSEYCKENRVDFSQIRYELMTSEDTIVKDWLYSGDYCKCLTWVDITEEENLINSYWWEIREMSSDVGRQFVYNSDNNLQVNFQSITNLG